MTGWMRRDVRDRVMKLQAVLELLRFHVRELKEPDRASAGWIARSARLMLNPMMVAAVAQGAVTGAAEVAVVHAYRQAAVVQYDCGVNVEEVPDARVELLPDVAPPRAEGGPRTVHSVTSSPSRTDDVTIDDALGVVDSARARSSGADDRSRDAVAYMYENVVDRSDRSIVSNDGAVGSEGDAVVRRVVSSPTGARVEQDPATPDDDGAGINVEGS